MRNCASLKIFSIPEDKTVYKSILRDFKAGFGRIHDEASLIEYINSQLDNTDLNNYQKTVAADRMRKSLIEGIEYTIQPGGTLHQFVKAL